MVLDKTQRPTITLVTETTDKDYTIADDFDWRKELESEGVTRDVQELVGIRLSDRGMDYVEYDFAYPPMIKEVDGKSVVEYPKSSRKRLLKSANSRYGNERLQRFLNPPNDELPTNSMPMLYTHDWKGLKDAIQKAGGTLHLYEGDKDTWTSIASGMRNSAGIFGAGARLTSEFVHLMTLLGVSNIRFYPDRDHAGYGLAERLLELVSEHSKKIVFTPFKIDPYLNNAPIKDTSDMWVAGGMNPDKHFDRIMSLPRLNVMSKSHRTLADSTSDFFKGELYQEIESLLGLTDSDFNTNGWSKNIRCPFGNHEHDDLSPAFGWNRISKTGRCFKCETPDSLTKDVADALGLNYRDYVIDNRKQVPSIKIPEASLIREERKAEASQLEATSESQYLSTYSYKDVSGHLLYGTLDDGLSTLERKISGELLPEIPPIVFPMKAFHHLGGDLQVMGRPKLMALFGTAGGFKCVTGDTRIITEKGMIRIDELSNGSDGFTPLSVKVLTRDGVQETSHFYDSGIAPTKKVTTRFGYSVSGTYNHPLLVYTKSGEYEWRKLDELTVGDYLCVERKQSLFGDDLKLPPPPKSPKNNDGSVNKSIYRERLSLPDELTVDLAYIFGALTGDGGLTRRGYINISTADEEILSKFIVWSESLGRQLKHRSNYDYAIRSVELWDWLDEIGLCEYSYDKKIPECIWKAPKHIVSAYLRGLFDTDGYVGNSDKRIITLNTSSEQLAKDVHTVLLQFGIISKLQFVNNAKRGAWRITIRSLNTVRFMSEIGFNIRRKQKVNLEAGNDTNVDVIPYLPHVDVTKLSGSRGKRGRLRERLHDVYKRNARMSYDYLSKYLKTYDEFKPIYNAQYFFDPIVSIEDTGEQHCYDITVPSSSSFISNGIVSHNTSFAFAIAIEWLKQGLNGIIYSPEWNLDQHTARVHQIMGGHSMARQRLHERYMYEQYLMQGGEHPDLNQFGESLTVDEIMHSQSVIESIRKGFKGKLYFTKNFGSNVLEVLSQISEIASRMISLGHPPDFIFVDYAQMLYAPPIQGWTMEKTILEIKKLAHVYGTAMIVASQVTKEDTKQVRKGVGDLTGTSGVGVRDDQFQVAIALAPLDGISVHEDGRRIKEIRAYVVKHNEGAKAESTSSAIPFYVDLDRLSVMSTLTPDAYPEYSILNDDPDLGQYEDDIMESF